MTPADLLLARYHSGDLSAGNALVREFENIARSCAFRWRRRWIDDDDLMQVGRMAIWRAIDPAAPTPYSAALGHLPPWIRSAVNSALYRYVRDQGKRCKGLVYLDDPLHTDSTQTRGDALASPHVPADVALVEHERSTIVRQHLDKLAGHQGAILRRRYAGETLEQIGADIGVTRECIRQRETRAMESVRRMLALRNVT